MATSDHAPAKDQTPARRPASPMDVAMAQQADLAAPLRWISAGRSPALRAGDIRALQRSVGNQAVQEWLDRQPRDEVDQRSSSSRPSRSPTPRADLPAEHTKAGTRPAPARLREASPDGPRVTGWLGGGAAATTRLAVRRSLVQRAAHGRAWVQRWQAPPTPPKTEHNFAGANTAKGWRADESWLSYKAGDPKPVGSAANQDPPGYTYIKQQLNLTHFWIRFHLVNEQAGGLGIAKNLVPASQKTNQAPDWTSMETAEKNEYNAGNTFHFATQVTYHPPHANPTLQGHQWQEYFPSKIEAKLYRWDGVAKKWKAPKVMNPLKPGLPPMNPAHQDVDLTAVTGYYLNGILGTERLGVFIVHHLGSLLPAIDEDDFVDKLNDEIAAYQPMNKSEQAYKRRLHSEFDEANRLLARHIAGYLQPQLNLQ